jgi:endoglucanase
LVAATSTDTSTSPSWHAFSLILRPGVAGAPVPTATPAPTAAPTPVPTAPPSGAVSALRVQGNQLLNALGQQVVLRGVNRSGTEYACVQGWGISEGAMDQASVNGIKTWHANVVRMPLNEQCWLGINGINPTYSGANYRTAITNYVNLLNQNGLYVLLDLHWSAPGTTLATHQVPMADLDHSPAFWSSVASTFKGNNAVIFELFNEPWPDSQQDSVAAWTCWRDGGTCPGVSFQVAGMQTMLNAVRATGATNIVALGGVGYSNYLSRWLQYKPSDPLNNLMAAWHAYNFNACSSVTCWNGAPASVIAQVPVSVTETGANTCDSTWWNTLLDWLDAHQTGYQAWAWNTWGGADCTYSTGYVSLGALITSSTGTATPYGQIYKNHITRF